MISTTTGDLEIPILPINKVRRKKSILGCLCFWNSGSARDDDFPEEVTDPEAALPSEGLVGSKDPYFDPWLPCYYYPAYAGLVAVVCLFFYLTLTAPKVFDKPEIRLHSVYVCPVTTTTSDNNNSNFMIWDLKLNITNNDNHTLCIHRPFEVSVSSSSSSYNGTQQLLAMAAVTPHTHTCVAGLTSYNTSALGLQQVANEDSLPTNGTLIRFDLKFHAHFYFIFDDGNHYPYAGDLVCKDAKVAFLKSSSSSCNSSSSSSCGCMVGDHFHCTYELDE